MQALQKLEEYKKLCRGLANQSKSTNHAHRWLKRASETQAAIDELNELIAEIMRSDERPAHELTTAVFLGATL